MTNDKFGDRMKEYEMAEAGRKAMPGLPLLARLDGRAFHTFTKGMKRPYDAEISYAMIDTTKFLVDKTHADLGYTQSDEITLFWRGSDEGSEYMFDGRFQKLSSVLAGMASAQFMKCMITSQSYGDRAKKLVPSFDCRVWQVPSLDVAADVFAWRAADAIKNSVSMAAQAHFSHKELQNKNSVQKKEMLWEKGVEWGNYPWFFKQGTFVKRINREVTLTPYELSQIPEKHRPTGPVLRTVVTTLPDFAPLGRVKNRAAYLFDGEEAILHSIPEEEV